MTTYRVGCAQVRRLLVVALEACCGATRHAHGCQLVRWSDALDQRWGTGVWKPYTESTS